MPTPVTTNTLFYGENLPRKPWIAGESGSTGAVREERIMGAE
jgi:hypothetical protein